GIASDDSFLSMSQYLPCVTLSRVSLDYTTVGCSESLAHGGVVNAGAGRFIAEVTSAKRLPGGPNHRPCQWSEMRIMLAAAQATGARWSDAAASETPQERRS